jgi:hypothetical protein
LSSSLELESESDRAGGSRDRDKRGRGGAIVVVDERQDQTVNKDGIWLIWISNSIDDHLWPFCGVVCSSILVLYG